MIYQMRSFVLNCSQPPDAFLWLELRERSRVQELVSFMTVFDLPDFWHWHSQDLKDCRLRRGDVLVTGAVWLTEKLCEIISKSGLLFWQRGSCWGAVSDLK